MQGTSKNLRSRAFAAAFLGSMLMASHTGFAAEETQTVAPFGAEQAAPVNAKENPAPASSGELLDILTGRRQPIRAIVRRSPTSALPQTSIETKASAPGSPVALSAGATAAPQSALPVSPATQTPRPAEKNSAPVILSGSPTFTAQLAQPALPADFINLAAAENRTIPTAPLPSEILKGLHHSALPMQMIHINEAEKDEVMELLKLDARRARILIEFRTVHGKFRTPEDLAQVSGIDDDDVLRWENQRILIFD